MDIWLINHYAVPPQYYPLARPTNFAKYLMRMGHTVTVFSASTVHNSDRNLITDQTRWREETVDGVHHVYVRCHRYRENLFKRVYNMWEFALKLPGVAKFFPPPDVIVATSMPPSSCAVGIHLARKYGCKGIAEIADLWPESIIAYSIVGPHNLAILFLRRLEKWIYEKADAIVFTMEGGYDYIAEQGWEKKIPKRKVFFINNGVDLEAFQYNQAHFRISDPDLANPDLFKVIYVGSIRKANNIGALLNAAKKVTNPKIKFLIWGGGNEKEALERRIKKEHISNVTFKGIVEKKYVPYITGCADLNLVHNMPSALFRFGISFNKLFDYMAAGKPILSDFPCPYNPAVEKGAGISVDNPTADSIARTVEGFAAMDPEQYENFCKKALASAVEYDFKKLTAKLIDVIENRI